MTQGGDPDAFVADLETGTITRASQSPDGTESNNWRSTPTRTTGKRSSPGVAEDVATRREASPHRNGSSA